MSDPALDPALDPARDPVAFFRGVAAAYPRCFWLDGGGAREWSGRRSMVGWLGEDDVSLTYSAARREVRRHVGGSCEVVGDDVFVVLEAELAAGAPDDHWVGYLGYACRPDLPASTGPGLPDAVWMRPAGVRFFDHGLGGQSRNFLGEVPAQQFRFPRFTGETDPAPPAYATAFEEVQEQLRAGNSYEVNLTYRLAHRSGVDPVTAYLRLRELNPAPYAGFLQHDVRDVPDARAWLLSSSPERYALVTADRSIETKPIKGTTLRGATPAEDEASRHRLATDSKFRAENLMIVDLLRNDLSMVCRPGTVSVPALMDVESYATVHQLVSTVRGELRDDVSTVQALRALFPAGSMTGAPKLRTMQVIEQVEATERGPYAGAFGWVCADGRADLGVVIRSLASTGDGAYLLGTGGGITVRSEVAEEYAESRWKADRLLAALG
ncbi:MULTISPECIES: anthranilate synthase component I family protein [unclassified Nocardioides]|uniref:anthranilate synthase component I family protein n=1 Tax=unclassified Nocardioides TaxID=2615069 RepID=UPI0000EB63D9|nr:MULTISPECIES: anthranilate synthase component I family protein [unclassified Nocardioides]ABL84024.1 Anthranilate synthase component I and chorismate binding protein [Nocardioides sp. JS614]